MAAGATYEPIATNTLTTAAASITFSSIPATYTDLRIVVVGQGSSGFDPVVQFNSDTATNYSCTEIVGTGTAASSDRQTSSNFISFPVSSGMAQSSNWNLITYNIFSYAGSTYKTCLATLNDDLNGSGSVNIMVGLWRSTSAINTFVIKSNPSGNFAIGTIATLYGIKAA